MNVRPLSAGGCSTLSISPFTSVSFNFCFSSSEPITFPLTAGLFTVTIANRRLELSENLTIAPLQCFACSKGQEFLRILSGNVILTSIKGHNSLTNLQKMTANNPNVEHVNMNAYIKFGENLLICSQDIEPKRNFGVNQEP